jgi:hypothetical protein
VDICCRSFAGGHVLGRQRILQMQRRRGFMRLPTAPSLALTLLSTMALAGCGSSGGAGGSKAGTATTAARSEVGLVEYLAHLEPKDKQLEQLRQSVLNAVDGVNERRPDASWERAARRLKKVTTGLDRLSVSIQNVRPPSALKAAHSNLAESVAVLEGYVYDVQNALTTRIPPLLASAANEDSTRMAVLRGTWEAAVAAYARKLGITLPAWLGGPSLAA